MKWYKYLFFYCLVFFCFSCNVFGIKIANEPYIKDCKGNVVSKVENKKGNDNPNSDTNNCSVDLNKNIVYSERDDQIPNSCKPEPTTEEKARSILLLIDNSYSMHTADKNWKVKEVRRIFRKIAKQMESNDTLYIKYFRNHTDCKDDICNPHYNGSYLNDTNVEAEVKQILKYTDTSNGESCTSPLCYGTPTYSVDALEKAKKFVKKQVVKSVPIVIFITDGYPTSYGTDDGDFDLGYLSSARHFYQFAVAMKELKQEFDSLKTRENGNSYIKDGTYSPKFVTIGLGVDNNNNFAAKYLLNTDKDTLDKLNIHKNGDTQTKQKYREDSKFYNMLNTSKGDDKYEITASIASNPDLGVAGALPDKNDRKITFSADALSIIKKTNGEVAFGPIKTSSIETVKYFKKSGKRCIQTTANPSGWLKSLSGGYENFSVITIPYNSCLLENEVTINLNKKVNSSLKKYHSGNVEIGSSLNGFVSEYYGKTNGNSVEVPEIQKILKYENDGAKPTTTPIHVERYTHNGINSDIKYKYLGIGYVRHCASLTTSGQICTPTRVAVSAKYFIDYTIKFNGGTLKDNSTSISPGTGFKFQNLQTTVDGIWYYTGYADAEKQDPIIEYQFNGKSYDINCNSVYKDEGLTTSLITPQDLWKQIDESVRNEKISFNSKYTTVDSNDNTNINKDISSQIDSITSFDTNPPTVNDHDTHYVTTKTDSIKKSCIKETNFEYVDEDENCPAEYAQTDSYAGEDFSYIEKNGRYYFIPFGYKQDTVDVTVELNVAGKELSTTCSIRVNDGGSPCEPTNSSEPKSIEDQVSYRSIDKDNPFPRANNKYYSIPINWRSWYCSSSGTSGNCIPNTEKQKRLSNSYSNIYYSKKYSSQDLTNIAKQTLSDSKVYYSSWNNIVNITGKSNSIGATNSDSTKIIEEKFGSTKSYCPLGSFKENCDQVMLK